VANLIHLNSGRRWKKTSTLPARQTASPPCGIMLSYMSYVWGQFVQQFHFFQHLGEKVGQGKEGKREANHRIIGWKRPLRSSSPTIHPTPPCLLNHVPKCHIYTFFEHLQGWGLHHCTGQPGPMPEHSFSEAISPNIQSKPSLTQLEAIA